MTLSQVHHHHLAELRSLPAVLDSEGLRIGDQYVMFFAEAELMREHATHLLAGSPQADVLEVGLGLLPGGLQVGFSQSTRSRCDPATGLARCLPRWRTEGNSSRCGAMRARSPTSSRPRYRRAMRASAGPLRVAFATSADNIWARLIGIPSSAASRTSRSRWPSTSSGHWTEVVRRRESFNRSKRHRPLYHRLRN